MLKQPHLLIVPNSLLKQAKLQAQVWLPKGAFDILACAGSAAAQTEFWSENGPLRNSQFFKDGNKHRIIIFTTHSVCLLFNGITWKLTITQAFRGCALKYYARDTGVQARQTHLQPEVSPAFSVIGPHSTHHHNFFTQRWLTVSLDEAHDVRNMTRSFAGTLSSAPIAMILTATPLHTGISDLFNLGAMIRVPAFVGVGGYERFTGFQRSIAKARKSVTDNDIAEEQDAMMNASHEKGASALVSQAPASGAVEAVRDLTLDAIKWLSEGYSGCIIRRTANSKDWEGHTLNSLAEPQRHHVFIEISDADINRLHQIQEDEGKKRQVLHMIFVLKAHCL